MPRFFSWNVNGLRAVAKKGFAQVLEQSGADIFAVQETKATPDQLPDEVRNPDGYSAFFHSAEKKGYSGVGVYVKKEPDNVMEGVDEPEFDREGRVITLEYGDFYFINAYFPNAQPKLARIEYKLAFDEKLMEFAGGLRKKKDVVICGDLNVAHKEIDLANPKSNEKNPGFSKPEREWMDKFTEAGFVDTFRMFNEEPGQYTWWSYRFNARAKNVGWRIDYFVVNEEARGRVKEAGIESAVMGSDHCPVTLTFE